MSKKLTPMMRQYRRIKEELPDDAILFFRLGDFYEMFFDDAVRAAPVLGVALTKRNNVPMCGVPYHAVDGYLAKMVRAGLKVAICEQVEDPSQVKGIVRREVSRVVTPGTVTEDHILEASRNNYIAAVCRTHKAIGLALLDLSTGTFLAETVNNLEALRDSLRRMMPSECLVAEAEEGDEPLQTALQQAGMDYVSYGQDWCFEFEAGYDLLVRHFNVHSLTGFGCDDNEAVVGAAGALIYHVRETLRREISHVRTLRVRQVGEHMMLDDATVANLDLAPLRGKEKGTTLLSVLDSTGTPMGARMLRNWLLRPLCELASIQQRHDAVEAFTRERGMLTGFRQCLSDVRDLERLIARIGAGGGNARDLRAVCQSFESVPGVREELAPAGGMLEGLSVKLHELPRLVELINAAIVDEPPTALKEGGIIREGYSEELDTLRAMAADGRRWLAEYQAKEEARTGIKKLKVRHNKVFGYYIEISKTQLDQVPPSYTRKQTLVNAERFITPELKEYEQKIFGAHERAVAMEYDAFVSVRDEVVKRTEAIQETAEALASLDVLAALADRALALGYSRPTMTDSDVLRIKEGRHPIVEQMPDAERFVPNDALLDCCANQLAILTGPNMAGKSTYIRQVAVIAVMAHVGAFVPAESAELGLIDRVFTRVGASDDLARGRSTFMVEMQETANILNNATRRSLIVLDEIGRGTSTFDGISIAWAVAEHLHSNDAVKAKTLFATHYHELTELSKLMDGVRNYNVLVKERNDTIVFLRKIVEGGADKSYGIQVAQLAGMPQPVVERAYEILSNLEESEENDAGQPVLAKHRRRKRAVRESANQMMLFN